MTETNHSGICTQSSASGSGKLILLGEHAVVYGYSAVALALPKGLKVCIEADEQQAYGLSFAQEGRFGTFSSQTRSQDSSEGTLLMKAFRQGFDWAQAQGLNLNAHYTLKVEGALPFKVGLGSSAALSVATLKALAQIHRREWSKSELFEGAMVMERVFHHQPSGLDHRVSIEGGIQGFQRKQGEINLQALHHTQPLHLVLTWGPRQGTTADAVSRVAIKKAEYPIYYQELFKQIESNTQVGQQALQDGDLNKLGLCFDLNHKFLRDLGVVTPALDQACIQLRKLGALGAKMSGAGMGGTSFGLFQTQEQALAASLSLQEQNQPTWQVSI